MMPRGRAGVAWAAPVRFVHATERTYGNNLPGWTGSPGNVYDAPGPHPATQPMGGHVGKFDGASGADPWAAKRQPCPRVVAQAPESASGDGAGPALGAGTPADQVRPLGYGYGIPRTWSADSDGGSSASRLGRPGGYPLSTDRNPGWWRGGIQGFNDDLQVRDRHAYYSTGRSRNSGSEPPQSQNSGRNPQLDGPPMPTLETVNISVNPQIGSDHTGFADDLTRPYTWLGQQDGTRVPVNGGVPGLWIPYGSRGGVPFPIVDPTNGEGGPAMVYPGPPHGLHSDTIADGRQLSARYKSVPQMRPVRIDRPDNSRIAGQSYSQTVQRQGQTQTAQAQHSGFGLNFSLGGSWRGRGEG